MEMNKTSAIVLSLGLAASANAALSVQDAFTTGGGPVNYDDATDLKGQGPSSATGFTGNWVGTAGWGTVSTAGLSSSVSGYVGSSGGSINNTSVTNGRVGHELASAFTGATTGTYYLSFLMDLSDVGTTNTGYRAFEAHTASSLANGVRNWSLGIHNDGDFGTLGGSLKKDTIGMNVGGQNIALGDVTTDTGANLFLIKFVLSATAASDSVTAWMNPALTASGDPAGGQTLVGRDVAFSFLSMADFGDGNIGIDGIRLGTKVTEVVDIPEPSSAALLLGLGGLALVLRRRK